METINNPASRFHQIILEGKRHPANLASLNAWAATLSTNIDDKPLLLSKIGKVISLPQTIQENISSLNDINHTLHLKWLSKVEQSFSTLNLQVHWGQFINHYDEEVIYGLEICSDLLSRRRPEKIIDTKNIQALLSETETLKEEILKSNLSGELVNYLINNLSNIKNALENYDLIGTVGVEKEVQAIIGSIVINNNFYHETKKTSVGKKVWDFLGKVAIVATLSSSNPIQIGNDIIFGIQTIEPAFKDEIPDIENNNKPTKSVVDPKNSKFV